VLSARVDTVPAIDMKYARDEHRVHVVAYHLVWCPKRGKRVLVDGVGRDCERIVRDVCAEHGWQVIRLAVAPDHVHLFVRADPRTPAHVIARACKGRTSGVLRDRYPALRRLPSLWTRSYFCSTMSNVSQATVDRFIVAEARL
jgi:putative transposase